MQSYTPTSPSTSPVRELLSRFLRTFRTAALAERPAMRWAEMRPIDFQGEDASLTQEQLAVLR
jgi:hypothetical protein